ncbi:hypothetical protein Tco_1396488 [Tanacetum coccineum]
MEIFQTNNAKGYDLLLWGDLKILVDPKEDGDIWKNQHEWNLLSWKLHNFCGVHMLLMDTGLVIYMMVEKKYPLSKDTISKMLSRRLEIDYQSEMSYELIRRNKQEEHFIHSKEMDLETTQNNVVAKLPLLKQGDYEMWKLRIEQYLQVQDYALWDIIENGNSFNPVARTTTNADGTSTSTIPGPVTKEEKTQKKNDVKAKSMLLMALLNEHQLTFNQCKDTKTFSRFGGNDATNKTQKTLMK